MSWTADDAKGIDLVFTKVRLNGAREANKAKSLFMGPGSKLWVVQVVRIGYTGSGRVNRRLSPGSRRPWSRGAAVAG